MAFVVMIEVDLADAGALECASFEREMARRRWSRLPKGDAGYCAAVKGCRTDAEVLAAVKAAIAIAARSSGVHRWRADCYLAGSDSKVGFSSETESHGSSDEYPALFRQA